VARTILVYARGAAEHYAEAVRRAVPTAVVRAASDPAAARAALPDAEILLSWRLPHELYALAARLRWVQCLGAGVEDIVAAAELPRSVAVTRIVDQFGAAIAEYVFAELLARVRELERVRAQQAERLWRPFVAERLAGRTLGVAGLGSIGREVVRKGRAFDMRVFGLSRTAAPDGLVDRHFGPDAWAAFVRDLDYLVLALPLTPQTRAVVGAEVLAAMRPGSVLVNVGRGALVDEAALVEALRAGRPGGAVLDVFEREPLPPESPLWSLPGVTVSPHISGPSRTDEVAAFFLDNLARFERGEPLAGLVERERGY
jgi:glyoxylate/hydroxypyruvate reductase A